jgi:hypothetical protein
LKRIIFYPCLFALCIIFNGHALFAQTKTITGKVTDSGSGDAIPFANVYFKGGTLGVTTDFNGNYSLKIPNGVIPRDTLHASNMGYETRGKVVNRDLEAQVINFQLQNSAYNLKEVVISSGENPAFRILREVVKRKPLNDKRSLSAYQYESYNKIEVDVDNISDRFRNKKLMKKITRVVDSLAKMAGEDGKPILPLFISEAVSNFYYRSSPMKKRENILKTKITGVGMGDGSTISQLIGSAFQDYNFYDNWLSILKKDFASPIGDGWKANYEYYLADSLNIGDFYCYRLDVEPKRKGDLAFTGTMWIDSKSYALVQIDVSIGKEANLNFIDKIKISQELEPATDSLGRKMAWLPARSRILIDVSEISNNSAGMLAKFYTSNRDFVINQPKPSAFYDVPVEVAEDSKEQEDGYWDIHRHEPLSEDEKKVFVMIDSIKNIPVVKTYVEIFNILVNGYKTVGKVDIGPYLFSYAYNNIEGNRFRLGFRTNEHFSRHWVLKGYGAYGTRDGRFKYSGEINYIASRKYWTVFGLRRTYDLERLGATLNDIGNSNQIFQAAVRFGNYRRAYFQTENMAFVERELRKGFTQTIRFRNFKFRPEYVVGQFAYHTDPDQSDASRVNDRFTSSELVFESRFAKDEKFLQKGNQRISLGTTKWPVLMFRYTMGLQGVLGSNFQYHKFQFYYNHSFRLGVLGRTHYKFGLGYIPTTLPYPLLGVHLGNQSPFHIEPAFNIMNFYEFISDRYASAGFTHRFEGLFFDRIPLVKKLKLRFLVTGNALVGSLRQANVDIIPAEYQGMPVPRPNALGRIPYLEVGYGIENIFRFIRVDFLHRLTYRNNPEATNFGVRVTAHFSL